MVLNFRLQFIYALTFFCVFFAESGIAQKTYLLSDTTTAHRVDTFTDVFIDPTDSLSIDQVIKPEFQDHFIHSSGNLTFGYLKSTIWLKVKVKNLLPLSDWVLEIPAPFLEYVDFYQTTSGRSIKPVMVGYYRPHNQSYLSHTSYILPLEFGDDSLSTIYIKIAGLSPKTFPLFITEKNMFIEKIRLEDIGYGLFFGVLFVMFFYNLFIFLTLKQTNYLLYICTIVCTFFIFVSASGYGGKFLWPSHPHMNFYTGRLSLSAITIFLSIFTIRFLDVKKFSGAMYYVLLSMIPLALLAAVLVITRTLSSAGNNLISLSTIVYMTTGIVCRIKGNKTANYFIAAWTIYLIGGLLLTLRNSGVFDFNFWTTHFVEIGATLETVIIAFALGDQYRQFKREKEIAQQHALKIQLGATEKLEKKVIERTEQLSKAYDELRVTLETNTQQTKIIENKNNELDAFFYRISHDLKGPISSLMGLTNLAKIDVKDEASLSYFDKQSQQIERLNNLITGLMDLAKLNNAELNKEKINFDKLIIDCISSFSTLPNFNKIVFKKDIQLEVEYYSEWTLLNAIIQNLIENSIKYSIDSLPYVHISIRRDAAFLVIEIADNGQGIPQEHQSKIFEMFYRATQNAPGTGLGLYILKRSVDRLHGAISLKSEVGAGSIFTIKLPLVNSAESSSALLY